MEKRKETSSKKFLELSRAVPIYLKGNERHRGERTQRSILICWNECKRLETAKCERESKECKLGKEKGASGSRHPLLNGQ